MDFLKTRKTCVRLPPINPALPPAMLIALTTLLLFQLAGEVIAIAFSAPVPGPVIGMALLLAVLIVRGRIPATLQTTAQTLLQHMSLLFVPAGTGVMLHAQRLSDEWLPILASLLISTLLGLLVTAAVMRGLIHLQRKRGAAS